MTDPLRFLWVLRHAKAEREFAGGKPDFDRELVPRGRRDAADLGALLAEGASELRLRADAALPTAVLTSAAERARQTAHLVAPGLPPETSVDEYRELYGADPDAWLSRVHEVDDVHGAVMVVGHNPTISELVRRALDPDGGTAGDGAAAAAGLATCGLAVVALPAVTWEKVSWGSGTLLGLFRPPYPAEG